MSGKATPDALDPGGDQRAGDLGGAAVVEPLMVAALAGGIEIWLLLMAAGEQLDWGTILLAHAAVVLPVAGWALWLWRRDPSIRTGIALAVGVSFLGPLGCGGVMLMCAIMALTRRNTKGFMEWYLSLFPEEQRGAGRDLFERLASGRARDDDHESVASFTDFLDHGTPEQKQTILALLARNFRPVFAPALRGAMNNPDATVRVMAATAVARIENAFLTRSMESRADCERNPGDYDVWLGSAQLYDDYAFTGILDADREAEHRRRAVEAYRECVRLNPAAVVPVIALGRLALATGRIDEAVSRFQRAIQLEPDRIGHSVWLMEALFRRGDFAKVRELARSLGPETQWSGKISEEVRHAVRLWREEAA